MNGFFDKDDWIMLFKGCGIVFLSWVLSCLIIAGCSPGNIIEPRPTGFSEKDFALQAYIETSNIAYCNREKNLDRGTDGYICLETKTDKTYYVPLHAWESGVKYDFELYAKAQVTQLLDVLKRFCDKIPEACKDTEKPKTLKSLKEFEL